MGDDFRLFYYNYKNSKDERSNTTGASGWQPPKLLKVYERGEGVSCQRLSSLDLCVVIFEIKEFIMYTDILKMSFMILYILTVLDLSRGLQTGIFQHISIRTNNRYCWSTR